MAGATTTIKLGRGDAQPWGFRLQGGKDWMVPLTVSKVNPGSLADKGGLAIGDYVLKIGGQATDGLLHSEAQNAILSAANNLEIVISKGGTSTWAPQVTPVGGPAKPRPASAIFDSHQAPQLTQTSLAKNPAAPSQAGVGSKFNTVPQAFHTFGTSTIPAVVHKQFNSPVNLYSMANIAETLEAHTEILAPGVKGINFMKPTTPVNTHSAVFLAILEEEAKSKGDQSAGASPALVQMGLSGQGHYHQTATPSTNFLTDPSALAHLRSQRPLSPSYQSGAFKRLQQQLDVVEAGGSPMGMEGGPSPHPMTPPLRQGFPGHIARPSPNMGGGHQQQASGLRPMQQQQWPPVNQQQQQQQQQQQHHHHHHQQQQHQGPPLQQQMSQTPAPPPKPVVSQPSPKQVAQPLSSAQSTNVTKHVEAPRAPPGGQNQGGSPRQANVCTSCGRLIVGVFCRVGGKTLHAECFRCSTCGSSLKNVGYFNINDKLYCDTHAQQAASTMSPKIVQPAAQPGLNKPLGPKVAIPSPSSMGAFPQSSGRASPLVHAVAPAPWHTPTPYHHVDAPASPVPGQIASSLLQTVQQRPASSAMNTYSSSSLPFAVPPMQGSRPMSMYDNKTPVPWGMSQPGSGYQPQATSVQGPQATQQQTQPQPPPQRPVAKVQAPGQSYQQLSGAAPASGSKFSWPPQKSPGSGATVSSTPATGDQGFYSASSGQAGGSGSSGQQQGASAATATATGALQQLPSYEQSSATITSQQSSSSSVSKLMKESSSSVRSQQVGSGDITSSTQSAPTQQESHQSSPSSAPRPPPQSSTEPALEQSNVQASAVPRTFSTSVSTSQTTHSQETREQYTSSVQSQNFPAGNQQDQPPTPASTSAQPPDQQVAAPVVETPGPTLAPGAAQTLLQPLHDLNVQVETPQPPSTPAPPTTPAVQPSPQAAVMVTAAAGPPIASHPFFPATLATNPACPTPTPFATATGGSAPAPFAVSQPTYPLPTSTFGPTSAPFAGLNQRVPPPTPPKPKTSAPWSPPESQLQQQIQQATAEAAAAAQPQPPGPGPAVGGKPKVTLPAGSIPGPGQSTIAGSIAPRRGRGQTKPAAGSGTRIPVCGTCSTAIRGPFVVAMGNTWCTDHFQCANAQCKRSLQDVGFVEEKGSLYCESCFENYLAPLCSKCNQRIKRDCLIALDKQWHPECFACSYCKKAFGNNSFYLEDGLPYCEKDWNELFTTKCIGCGFPIEAGDRWVEALSNNYHSTCFKCSTCHKPLEGQSFFAKGGRPYCKSHARG